MNKSKIFYKMILNITLIFILCVCFLLTTYALMKDLLIVNDNLFKTGEIKINLNDGKSIIDVDDFLFEPGMTMKKDFFVENEGTFDVYYKIYFDDISGDLANILNVTIKDKEKVLYEGTISELSRNNVNVVDDVLGIDEKIVLSMFIHYPEESNNITQNKDVYFRLGVDAVQTKNNINKVFD